MDMKNKYIFTSQTYMISKGFHHGSNQAQGYQNKWLNRKANINLDLFCLPAHAFNSLFYTQNIKKILGKFILLRNSGLQTQFCLVKETSFLASNDEPIEDINLVEEFYINYAMGILFLLFYAMKLESHNNVHKINQHKVNLVGKGSIMAFLVH